MHLQSSHSLGFLGKKLYIMQFIKAAITENKETSVPPTKIELDTKNLQMIIFTANDIRFFDLRNGKLLKILRG